MPKWLPLIFSLAALMPLAAQPPAGHALLISDVHFDPLADKSIVKELIARPAKEWAQVVAASADAPFAKRGSDANYSLIAAVLDAAAQKGPFDYVLFQGDALRHHFREAFIQVGGSESDFPSFATKTAVFLADILQAKFHAPVLFAIGNNDSACDDYRMDPDNSFFRDLSDALPAVARSAEAKSDFRSGGYYSIPNPGASGQEMIVLNSVFWSPKFSTCGPARIDARIDVGERELDWLASKLDEVQRAGRTAILVMHVPPGADVNASLGKCAETPFWKSQYLTRFTEIVGKHRGTIQFALAGHTHRDDFRMVERNHQPVLFIRISSSISPVYNNDPEFSVLTYAPRGGEVSDLVTYSLDLSATPPAWRAGYSFLGSYGMRALNALNGASLIARIRAGDQHARQNYETHYGMGASQTLPFPDFDYYGCALTTFSESYYSFCVCH
jgi:sphingomyelin phosphodiesterase acid-like 3